MSNNARKSALAVVSGFGLVASSFVALPASAAAALNIEDLNGLGNYKTVGGETFTLAASGNADFVGDEDKLRFKITNIDGVAISGLAIRTDGADFLTVDADVAALKADGTATDTALGGNADDTAVFGLSADNDDAAAGASTMTSPAQIRFSADPGADATASYKVEFFYDADNDGVLDAGELSDSATVQFVDSSDLAPSITIDAATEGGTAVGATVKLSGFALDQLTAANYGVNFTQKVDGVNTEFVTDASADAATLNAAKDAFTFGIADISAGGDGNDVDALAKDTYVSAQFQYRAAGIDDDGAANTNVGTAAVLAVTAKTVDTVEVTLVNSTTTDPANADALVDGEFQVKVALTDADDAAVANTKVTISVEALQDAAADGQEVLGDAKYIVVDGVKYDATAELPDGSDVDKLERTSNSAGEVVLTISTEGLDGTGAGDNDTNSVKVTAEVETLAAVSLDVDVKDASYTLYGANNQGVLSTTEGGTTTWSFQVRDQFGGVPANEYDLRAQFNSSAGRDTDATAASNTFAALVGGNATIAITDNGEGDGTNTYDVTVDKRQNGGGYVANSNLVGNQTAVVNILAAAQAAATIDMATGNADLAVDADDSTLFKKAADTPLATIDDFASFDSRSGVGSQPTVAANSDVILSGTVKTAATLNAAAAAIDGTSVTLSGAGVYFKATIDGATVWAEGSITVTTDGDGAFSVLGYSNTSGTNTVTVTSGSASSTVEFPVAAAADTTGATLTIDASAYVPAASTVVAKALLVDKYGNPVDVDANAANDEGDFVMTYSGPGLAVTASADATDADGMAQVAYFLGANDTGTITITAKYDKNGDEDYTDTGDLVVTKTITIGEAPAPAADTKVNAGSFKGYVAIYAKGHEGKRLSAKVGNDWVVVPALASNFVRVVEYTGAGYTIAVRIYIDRVLVDTITVTTK